jgi:PKD repeat protein
MDWEPPARRGSAPPEDTQMTASQLRNLTLAAFVTLFALLLLPHGARADVSCPSDIPVVQENNCSGTGSDGWRLVEYSPNVAGFATKTSVNRGENVTLKLGQVNTSAAASVRVDVYRMGYYGNTGGRLITAASSASVAVNNLFSGCSATNVTTGLKSCSGWASSYTIPGSALPASGVYTVKLTTPSGLENTITFVVRDDSRVPNADILFAVPTATYEAYNDWGGASGGKSLYFDTGGGEKTVSGTQRAVKVSFDRPLNDPRQGNRFIGPDFYLIQWLEKQGYDVAYTEDVAIHQNPAQLKKARVDMVSGHSEYWSLEQMNGYLAARDAGVNIASFSGNTAYWKVRYEDGGRTLVCYKTVEGSGSSGSGEDGANDWGPDGKLGTADDALGLDQKAGTADDHPENSTTTFRDNGAPPGDPNAPEGGRVGPDMPENQLLGNMYYGAELQAGAFPLVVPAASGGNYAGDRIWRNTGIPTGSATTIGANLLGWEWDAIPTQAQYLSRQPAGVKPLTNSTAPLGNNVDWIQDEGRIYAKTPPPGQCACGQAVKYTAKSGALVFASGTNNWANALAPNPDTRIIQATYNILSDMTAQPWTPVDLILDPPSGPQPPVASFSVAPNPAQTNQTVTFDGSSSVDLDGGIAKYEWDLNGDGTYEKDSGSNPVTTTTYATTGVYTVRLRVTDEQGVRSTTNRALSIDNSGSGSYPSRVLGTTGLISYWRLGDPGGSTALVDSFGTSNAAVNGSPTLGVAGALAGDGDTAASFDGLDDAATANLSLSGTSKVTVEFWMKWNGFANDDDLALEYTPNFNSFPGGFLIDPNAPQESGKFGVAIGNGSARNNVFFTRPSAGQWHHYAFVMDSAAAAADQIKPYVDGKSVSFTKTASGTGAGNFANSSLYFMSRAASALFGAGSLDELAIYNRALDASTVAAHYAGNQLAPTASFTSSPNPADVGQTVSFNGSSSTSPNGAIAKYEWDLDGNGSFETNTGASPNASTSYASSGPVTVVLRVTDAAGKAATASETISIDGAGAGSYSARVLATAGLVNYWRMGEASGSSLADSKGTAAATLTGGPTLGSLGAVAGDADTSVSFNGTSSAAQANLDLSATSKLTLEFWMKWDGFANDDDLAFELTPNFNSNPGGFIVDPNAPEEGGKFGVGIGSGESRNTAYFARPSAGAWHHYALVMDTGAPAADQVVPYVDGLPVPYVKSKSGTGAGNFANSSLFFMSRAASALFGSGDLDEVALYNRALPASTVEDHYFGTVGGGEPPLASFSAAPNPALTSETVNLDASGSSDPDGSIVKYEWDLDANGGFETETGSEPLATKSFATAGSYDVRLRVTDSSGNKSSTLRTIVVTNRAPVSSFTATPGSVNKGQTVMFNGSASSDPDGSILKYEWDLDGNGSFETNTGTTPTTSRSYSAAGTVETKLRVTDDKGATSVSAKTVTVTLQPPTASFTASPNPVDTGATVAFSGSGSSDPDGTIAKYEWDLDGNGSFETNTGTTPTTSRSYSASGTVETKLRVTDSDGQTATTSRTITINNRPPVPSFTVAPSPANTRQTVTLNGSASTDPDGTIAKFEWDLDGNGSFETSTGTTTSTTKSFTATGTLTLGLRVTDSKGATATTTRSLTVNSGYRAAVLGTSGISDFWRLDETSGTTATDANGANNNGTYTSSPTSVAPLIGGETNSFARSFNGTSQYIDLSPTPLGTPGTFSAEAWVRTSVAKSSGGYHFLVSDSSADFDNGFSLVIDSSNRPVFAVARQNILGQVTRGQAVSPTTVVPTTTHHIVGTYDGSRARIFVDGVERANVSFSSDPTWSGSRDLRIGRPISSTSLAQRYLQGSIDEPALYTTALSAATILAHYQAGKP